MSTLETSIDSRVLDCVLIASVLVQIPTTTRVIVGSSIPRSVLLYFVTIVPFLSPLLHLYIVLSPSQNPHDISTEVKIQFTLLKGRPCGKSPLTENKMVAQHRDTKFTILKTFFTAFHFKAKSQNDKIEQYGHKILTGL